MNPVRQFATSSPVASGEPETGSVRQFATGVIDPCKWRTERTSDPRQMASRSGELKTGEHNRYTHT